MSGLVRAMTQSEQNWIGDSEKRDQTDVREFREQFGENYSQNENK